MQQPNEEPAHNPQSSELTRKQERFLLAYMNAPTILAACREVGISDDTATNWLKKPHVRTALAAMRQEQLDRTLGQLAQHTTNAIAALARNIDKEAPPGVQVRAAQILLEQAIQLQKMAHIEAQIGELRAMLLERGYK